MHGAQKSKKECLKKFNETFMNTNRFIQILRDKIAEAKRNIIEVQALQLKNVTNYANITVYHYQREQVEDAKNVLAKWQQVIQEVLKSYYGTSENENNHRFEHTIVSVKSGYDYKEELTNEYKSAISVLEGIIDTIELLLDDANSMDMMNEKAGLKVTNNVFIVHGHDEQTRNAVELFVKNIDYNPIVLFKEPSKGQTIIEKIESNVENACFSIVIYTPCDVGRAREDKELKPRARQNVVFEHGYMCSKLGREHVVALCEEGVECPGDMSGVIYIEYDKKGLWQLKIAQEMKAIGLEVDANKIKI